MKKIILTFAALLALSIGGTSAFARGHGGHPGHDGHNGGVRGGSGGCVATQTCPK
jgi:hypothetical protein